MSRNGSGVYSLAAGNPVTTGTTISSTWANNTLTDIASALTASIASDGQTVITANLPMSTYAHTGVGVATARTMYGSAGQIQDSTLTYLTTIAGADVITAVAPVLMSAYATGQQFHFIAVATNTTAVTVNINAIGAKSVKKTDGSALIAGDIASGATILIVYDGTNFQFVNKATSSGDVVGPASATDNAVARFDATTGKLIQNSAVTIDDSGILTAVGITKSSLPTGSVLQVVNASYSVSTSTTSASYSDTGLTATITPTSATSKILVLVNQAGVGKGNSDAGTGANLKLLRGSTTLVTFALYAAWNNTASYNVVGSATTSYLDSPATTSATIYKTQMASSGTGTAYTQDQSDTSTITLMEIAA